MHSAIILMLVFEFINEMEMNSAKHTASFMQGAHCAEPFFSSAPCAGLLLVREVLRTL
jgi:hypothetical protein